MAAVVVLLHISVIFTSVFSAPVGHEHSYLDNVLSSIERLIQYYKSSYKDLNIDGLFGLRVLEGQLGIIMEEISVHSGYQNVSTDVISRIKSCKVDSTTVCNDAVKFVKAEDEDYYKMLHFVVGQPWTFNKSYQPLNFSMRWPKDIYLSNTRILTESHSDKCMSQLTGILKVPSRKCQISEDCIQMMTHKGLSGYGITHQLLWTMLSAQAGCIESVQQAFLSYGKGSVENLQKEFCANNFFEMIQTVFIVMNGNVLPRLQDLFLEQQFVCPNLGYYQFLSLDFLQQIMSWQKDNGCYGSMPMPSGPLARNDDYDYANDTPDNQQAGHNDQPKKVSGQDVVKESQSVDKSNVKRSLQPVNVGNIDSNNKKVAGMIDNLKIQQSGNVVIQSGHNLVEKYPEQRNAFKLPTERNPVVDYMKDKQNGMKIEGNSRRLLSPDLQSAESRSFKSRKLMAEKVMENGCLAHKTAVAAGALSMYLRYLLKPGPVTLSENSVYLKKHPFLSGDILLNTYEEAMRAAYGKIGPSKKQNANAKKDMTKTGDTVKLKSDKVDIPSQYNHANAVRREALNNNVLAAQLHGKNEEEENVYYENDHEKDDDYKDDDDDELYPQKGKGKVGQQHKMVQFDNGQEDNNKKKMGNNDKDEYNEENYKDDDGDEKDYDYNEKGEKQNGHDKDKNDDRDYPYYDDNNRNVHDDYTNEKEEKELLEKAEKNHKSVGVESQQQNVGVHTSVSEVNAVTVPTKTLFVITASCTFFLLLLMYRVIRSRRIHIRYNLRSLMRL